MSWQFIRFSIVGAINTLVGLLVIFGTKAFLYDNDVIANAAGYGTGLSISFVLNKSWTFRDRSSVLASGIRFMSTFAISYAFNLGTVLICIFWLGVDPYLAQVLGIPPYMVAFYWLCKYMAFRSHDSIKV